MLFTLVLRGVLSPFAHPLFTVDDGHRGGHRAAAAPRAVRTFYVLGGYVVAVFLHAVWNARRRSSTPAFLIVYVLVMLPLFAAMMSS